MTCLAAAGARVEAVESRVTGSGEPPDLAEAPAVALAPEGWPTGEGVVQIPVEEDLTLPLIWCA